MIKLKLIYINIFQKNVGFFRLRIKYIMPSFLFTSLKTVKIIDKKINFIICLCICNIVLKILKTRLNKSFFLSVDLNIIIVLVIKWSASYYYVFGESGQIYRCIE